MKIGRVSIFVTAFAVLSIFAYRNVETTQLSDCELARIWYETHPKARRQINSFPEFLDEIIRIGKMQSVGQWFPKTRYSVAIHYPTSGEFKIYDFFVSRAGKTHSQLTLSSSEDEWRGHRKIICGDI